MELLLRFNVPNLGKAGEIIKVRPGYARNYLLPKKLAIDVNPDNVKLVEKERKRREKAAREQREDLKALAKKLSDVTCTIPSKVAEEGHLYGSVSSLMIAEALEKMGYSIGEKEIRLESPIKETGTFPIQVHLHPEVEATIHVVVVPE